MSKKPMRVFEGSAKPFEPFWRVVDADQSESGEAEIEFYGYISEYSWFEDDITPARFKSDLDKLEGRPVTVRIHSGGGDVFAASAIRAMLIDYPGQVTTRIDGLAASAATYVAMAGDRVLMQDSAFFMIHNPAAMAYGTEADLKQAIKLLKTVKDGIVQTYQGKTQMDAERIGKMMDAETWMTAQEAQALGFVDEVVSERSGARNERMRMVGILNCLEGAPEDVVKAFGVEDDSTPTPTLPLDGGGGEELVVDVDGEEKNNHGDTENTEKEPDLEQELAENVAGEETASDESEPETEEGEENPHPSLPPEGEGEDERVSDLTPTPEGQIDDTTPAPALYPTGTMPLEGGGGEERVEDVVRKLRNYLLRL